MRSRIVLAIVLAISTSGAAAQPMPFVERGSQTQPGITVTGRGTAAASPTRARVTLTINGSSVGGVSVEDAAKALVDALHANGVADARTVFPVGNVNVGFAPLAVVGDVAKPTREKLEATVRAVVKALPDRVAPILAKMQITVAFVSDDCSGDEARAERGAFEDARAHARRIAELAGLHLGSATAVVATPIFAAGCATKPDTIEAGTNVGYGFGGLFGPLVLPINVQLTVTYAVR